MGVCNDPTLIDPRGASSIMVLSPGAASAVDITVLAGMGVGRGCATVRNERAMGTEVIVSFEAGPLLMQKVNAGAPAENVVTHYPRCDRRSHQAGQGGGQPR